MKAVVIRKRKQQSDSMVCNNCGGQLKYYEQQLTCSLCRSRFLLVWTLICTDVGVQRTYVPD